MFMRIDERSLPIVNRVSAATMLARNPTTTSFNYAAVFLAPSSRFTHDETKRRTI